MKRVLLFALCILFFASCKKDNADVIPAQETPSSGTATPEATAAAAVKLSPVPFGLPKHISFGTDGDISRSSQFISQSDYQYQYLADDIFNGGWASWLTPTGEYARNYLAQVDKLGKVPVFTYYNLVPAKGRWEDPAFTNLNDAEVMNKYFDDWKLLLTICKSYGKKVIIHYEPDLFGYFQMFRNDPTKQSIKVSASGQADVQGYTNDPKGLAQAIVAMRNKYAPNVVLGWHASTWATGQDLFKSEPDPVQTANATAAFYKSLNANYDIIFSEFSDRDEGYYQVVKGQNSIWSTLATPANGNLSDFDRFQQFLKALNQATGQKIILWQIPIGNNKTQTCNNTNGHYKDNRAEYFLQPVLDNGNKDKINQYGQAGVIAFLFGRGANTCTNYMDSNSDGVTASGELADDDGGYLRSAIKGYYQKGAITLP